MLHDTRFHAMGTDVHIIVVGDDADHLGIHAERRIRSLESRWSRFQPNSEVCAVNHAEGAPCIVSADTAAAIATAVEAWHVSCGLYDPTILDGLIAAGYTESWPFDAAVGNETTPSSGCSDIEVDRALRQVRLPLGTSIDLGGIGKGCAADVVYDELLFLGARGACVNLGGDLRVGGESPNGCGWTIALSCRGARPRIPVVVHLDEGAVATSSRLKRTWRTNVGDMHHLIDPRTGAPASSDVVSASVVGATAAQCEMLTKVAIVGGSSAADAIISTSGATALLTTVGGNNLPLEGWHRYERLSAW